MKRLLSVSILVMSVLFIVFQTNMNIARGISVNLILVPDENIVYTDLFPSNSNNTNFTRKSRVWVQLTFSTEYDQDIIPHTLHHYIYVLGVSPSDMIVALHVTDDKDPHNLVNETMQTLKGNFGIQHFSRWTGKYSSDGLWEARYNHRILANVKPCDWVVRSDADEFPAVPGNETLAEFLYGVGRQGYDAVFGRFNDRVALGGILPNITAQPSISGQFPLSCKVTEKIAKGLTIKVVAFRGHHRENRGGHGLLDPDQMSFDFRTTTGVQHCGYPTILRIDHYKWTFPVLNKLQQRYKHYKAKKLHFRESLRALKHIGKHKGKLVVDKLKCVSDPEKADYETEKYDEGKACGKLLETCPV